MAKEMQMYELGYLVLPIVAPEKVSDEVLALRSAIESSGGMILEEEQPKLRVLAYSVSKSIANKKNKFDQAYFGWIRYQVNPSSAPAIKEAVGKQDNILRFLIIKTIKEIKRPNRRPMMMRAPGAVKDVSKDKEKPALNEQDIDREIESMIGEQKAANS
jgi:ribosomal protein S6